ncbi:rCG33226, partial [Rattus norvegicus]
MELENDPRANKFIFLLEPPAFYLSKSQPLSLVLFLFWCFMYMTTLHGNLIKMTALTFESCLQTPINFIILSNICFSSIISF